MEALHTIKPVCQSCGTPMQKDFQKGTEKNGSPTDVYCRRCYSFGSFTDREMTVEKMSEIVHQKMIELKFPPYLANLLADHVHTLKRWAPPSPDLSTALAAKEAEWGKEG